MDTNWTNKFQRSADAHENASSHTDLFNNTEIYNLLADIHNDLRGRHDTYKSCHNSKLKDPLLDEFISHINNRKEESTKLDKDIFTKAYDRLLIHESNFLMKAQISASTGSIEEAKISSFAAKSIEEVRKNVGELLINHKDIFQDKSQQQQKSGAEIS